MTPYGGHIRSAAAGNIFISLGRQNREAGATTHYKVFLSHEKAGNIMMIEEDYTLGTADKVWNG